MTYTALFGRDSLLTNPIAFVFAVVFALLILASIIAYTMKYRRATMLKHQETIDNLIDRLHAWWVMVGLLAVVFWLGRPAIIIFFGIVSFFALREFITLTATRFSDYRALIVSFYIILPLQYWLVWDAWYGLFSIMIPVYGFLILPILSCIAQDTTSFLERTAKIQWGLMVSVFCISHLPALLFLELKHPHAQVAMLLIYLVFVVQLSDVMQYVWGKLLGRHKIAPILSPSKTVEGFIGGVLSASCIGMFLYPLTPFTMPQSFAMSLLICLMGFLGGIVMSAIKRDRGVKDWGYTVNGHGGVLDRMDSLCFSAPVFFHFVRYFFCD